MTKRVMLIVIACGVVLPAWGRLSETSEQCVARYGVYAATTLQGKFLIRQYAKAGVAVTVYFVKKREKRFDYTEAVGIIYAKPGRHWRDGNLALTPEELRELLQANAAGQTWQEVNLIKLAAEAKESETAEKLHAAHNLRVWEREDGATAHYMRHSHELAIRSDPQVPLPKATPAKQEAPGALKGF